MAAADPAIVFVAWFADTLREYKTYFNERNIDETRVQDARTVYRVKSAQNTLVLLEHFPLAGKELAFLKFLEIKEMEVYSSLDEAIFLHFGSEKIIALAEKMGMSENEAISHPFITKSIKNIQENLSEKVDLELSASSQEDWIKKNIRL